jgi:phosphate/sulfate permease
VCAACDADFVQLLQSWLGGACTVDFDAVQCAIHWQLLLFTFAISAGCCAWWVVVLQVLGQFLAHAHPFGPIVPTPSTNTTVIDQ